VNSQNFTVTTINDTPDANLADGICDDGTGNCSLRAAVMESNALTGSHSISLPAGLYTLGITGAGEDLSATGDLDIHSDITLIGASPLATVIDADSLDRVFHVHPGNTVAMSLLTVKEGFVIPGNGGGILNLGSLSLNEVHISDNVCELNQGGSVNAGFGGGIANEGDLSCTRVTLFNNTAVGGRGTNGSNGGGGGGSTPGLGGGIYNGSAGNIVLENTTISSNAAIGGMNSGGSTNGGNFTMVGNPGAGPNGGAGGAAGGGGGANASGDYSGGGGGGSSAGFGGTGGLGGFGGGGGGRGAQSGGGSTGPGGLGGFGGGQGSGPCCSSGGGGGAGAGLGGGIFNDQGSIITTNVTIAFNKAQGGQGRFLNPNSGYAAGGTDGEGYGGGIFNRNGIVDINNTILSNNVNINDVENANLIGVSSDEDLYGTFVSSNGHNLVFNPGSGVLIGNTAGNVISADPGLQPLADNGGTTYTHAILPCPPGPAVNAADDALAPLSDQRGFARNGIADIGSFESDLADIEISYELIEPCENASNGSITVTPQSTPNYTYQWDAAAGSQTDSTAINLAAGMYTVTITDGNGCVKDTSFDLIAAPIPLFDSFSDQEECESYVLPPITGSTLSGNEGYYSQSGGVGTPLNQGDAITTTQTVFVYDIIGSCSEEVTFLVTIHDLPEVISFTGEGTYCEGEIPDNLSVEIEGQANFVLNYSLDGAPMSINSSIDIIDLGNTPGVYILTGIQDNNCSNISALTQNIIVHPLPLAPVVTGETEFCTNEQILPLTAQGNPGTFTWYADETLLQVISTEDQFTPENIIGITNYYITITENGCEGASQMIPVEVKVCDVIIPTAFTPDDDDINDTWNIVNLDLVYPNNVVSVFNRFGNKIYESMKGQYNQMPWDGTHESNSLPVASYFYLIEYNDEHHTNTSGTVTIVK